jgi:hypothetical protein
MSAQILLQQSVSSTLGRTSSLHLSPLMIDKAMSSAGPSDDARGRRRTRDSDDNDDDLDDGSVPPPGSSKKRRRSRKGLDKKFECPHEGCGRSYSRAEHLYRHQLNRKFAASGVTLVFRSLLSTVLRACSSLV